MILTRLVLLVSLLMEGPLAVLQAQVATKVPGCWRMSFTPWSPSAGGDSILYEPLPDSVRLSAVKFDSTYFHAIRRPNVVPELLRQSLDSLRAFWRPIGFDSIEVWFPVWWSTGVRTHLRLVGDTLQGRGWVYVDYTPHETPYTNVRGVRCGGA